MDSPKLVLILDKFLIFVSAAIDLGARELLFVDYTLFALLWKMSLFLITKSDKNYFLNCEKIVKIVKILKIVILLPSYVIAAIIRSFFHLKSFDFF